MDEGVVAVDEMEDHGSAVLVGEDLFVVVEEDDPPGISSSVYFASSFYLYGPTAGGALAPLKQKAEQQGKADFSSLWSGQAAAISAQHNILDAGQLTQQLAEDALKLLA